MINQFQKRGYNSSLIEQQINKANLQEKEQLLKAKKNRHRHNYPFIAQIQQNTPKIKESIIKHWHLLHMNPNLAKIFQNPPILAFHRNKNLGDTIETKLTENAKVKRKFTNKINTR